MEQLEKFFEDFFLKKISYSLPPKAKEMIVKAAPWLMIIGLILMIPSILALFGLGTFFPGMGMMVGMHFGARYYSGMMIIVVQAVLMAMSISGLMNRKIQGWRYIYYSELLSIVYAVLFTYGIGSAIWSLIGVFIGLYIIFQVKSYYK